MKFTDNPFEKMMQKVPCAPRPKMTKAPPGTLCRTCGFWRGVPCVAICYRELQASVTSGQVGPKLDGGKSYG